MHPLGLTQERRTKLLHDALAACPPEKLNRIAREGATRVGKGSATVLVYLSPPGWFVAMLPSARNFPPETGMNRVMIQPACKSEAPAACCPACGSVLPPGPVPLCPGCLLRAGLADGQERETLGDPWTAAGAPREAPGTVIGRYRLLEEIGEGGFAVVYLAEQTEPVPRKVALKLLKPGMDSRETVARFEAERQALALMDHPNIAQIYDGGTTESGRPYVVMELVKGVPITRYCDEHRYGTANGFAADILRHLHDEPVEAGPPSVSYRLRKLVRRRKGLFAAVSAVAAALLVGVLASLWQACIAGKARDAATAARDLAHQESVRRGGQLREAARSDRLLAMELFDAGRDADAFAHLARACDYDPESTLAAETAIFRLNLLDEARQVAVLKGTGEFPLARIDRAERFRRIDHREDLEMNDATFTPDGDHVVTIRDHVPADAAERERGNWPPLVAELWNAGTGRRERMELVPDHPGTGGKPPGIRIFDTGFPFDRNGKTAISPDGTAEVVLENETAVLRQKGASTEGVRVAALREFDSLVARFAPDGLRVASAGEDHRVRLHTVPGGREMARCTGHAQAVTSVRFSPDGSHLVTASDDTTARVWEIADRRLSDRFGWDDGMLWRVRFSRDDRRIIAGGSSGDGSLDGLLLWDALTGEWVHDDPFRTKRASLVGCNSSGTVAILREGGEEGSGPARVWDVQNRREVARLGDRAIGVDSAWFSPDDRVVAIVEHDGSIRVWDAGDGHQISEVARATGIFPVLCFSPDSRSLLIGPKAPEGEEQPAIMAEVATGKVLFELPLGSYNVMSAAFNPAGTLVATGSNDGKARIWEMPSGKLLATLPEHPQTVKCVEFSPDGTMLATACWRSTVVQVWRVGSWQRICRIQNPSYQLVEQVAFSPDSHLLAGASDRESTLRIWETRSGQCVASLDFAHAELRDLAFSHDGKRLVIPCRNSGAMPESGGPLVLEVPAVSAPVPGWFSDFLRLLLQSKIGDDGQKRVLTPVEWVELRDRVTAAAGNDRSRYGELARWFLAPASLRPVRPGAAMTRHELADRLVTPEAGPVQLARALAFDPANALAHLAMARFVPAGEARVFLQTWGHQHLPDRPSPELRRRIDAILALPPPTAPSDE